jgi:23S rRNA (cytidine1920-2'-O)/16S rRNA (cytidine1409-2'-O)-methyltransferase
MLDVLSIKRRKKLSEQAPLEAITAGRVRVDGRVIKNPNSKVLPQSSIVVDDANVLRGELKLGPALAHFGIRVEGRFAVDVGAAAGGFTKTLLDAGARRVYAVDAGHGQLLGSLRQDSRVVNLELTNLGDLTTKLVPDPLGVITLDLSYLSLTNAVPQLESLLFEESTDLIALIKPMFELGSSTAPSSRDQMDRALATAREGVERSGWSVIGWMDSQITGAKGAPELFLHARR